MDNANEPAVDLHHRPPAVIHVDLDGLTDIYFAHGWKYSHTDDSIFETGLKNILALLERNGVRATFFVIASSLDNPRKRELVQEAVRRGHEIASHSLTHPPRLKSLDRERKSSEIGDSRQKLEEILGLKVRGFRAPGYEIDRACIELLMQYGYEYDSSAFPTASFARRLDTSVAKLAGSRRPFPGTSLIELPLPDYRPLPFPFNPSYSLLFGPSYFQLGLKRFLRSGAPLVLLFHLIDVADPIAPDRLKGLTRRLFTLSILSGQRKLERCQKMLDLVRQHYTLTTTPCLLEEQNLRQEVH